MNQKNYHSQEGYRQGFTDGKRTGGRITRRYIENVFQAETKHLSYKESIDYKIGWQDGFTDAVNSSIKSMVENENFLLDLSDELAANSRN
jgi:hypothetical protein